MCHKMILLNFCTKCDLLIGKHTYKASQMISIKGLYQNVSEHLWKPSAYSWSRYFVLQGIEQVNWRKRMFTITVIHTKMRHRNETVINRAKTVWQNGHF